MALAAVVHALSLRVFYHGGSTCVEIFPRLNSLKSSIPDAGDSKALAMLDAVQTKNGGQDTNTLRHADDLAGALKLDMGQWFTPTASNFFAKISKQATLAAIAEAKGTPCAPSWEKLKKLELAALAERQTAGTGWLPKPVRLRPEAGAVVAFAKAA